MRPDIELIWLDLRQELKKFMLAKLRDEDTAEDLMQDVFIKAHLNIHQVQDAAKLTSWIYQIARNTVADHFKEKSRTSEKSSPEWAADESVEPIYQSLSQCINSKISKLSKRDREAVLLTYFKNYSQKELANFLGISYSGAKNRIQRAREKLRLSILDCGNVESDSKGRIIDFNG